MEPIITLQYSEWIVAELLKRELPESLGYSVYAPLSRQEKGVDLLITRRLGRISKSATLQVKYSRAYESKGKSANFNFTVWFRALEISERADYYLLTSLYPNITGRGHDKKEMRWKPIVLLFTNEEMKVLINSLQTRKGTPEKMFYFCFNDSDKIFFTRGTPEIKDFSSCIFKKRIQVIRQKLQ